MPNPTLRFPLPQFTFLSFALSPLLSLAADANGDGLDDLWQQRFNVAAFSGAADPDNDGRPNVIESINFTAPNNPADGLVGWGLVTLTDTNGDRLDDTWAAKYQITSTIGDPDGDGRTNLEESIVGSNPLVADTPYPLSNQPPAAAKAGSSFTLSFRSLPTVFYTVERSPDLITWTPIHTFWGSGATRTESLTVSTIGREFFHVLQFAYSLADPDGDGLSNWHEVNVFASNPSQSDSDGDGLPDGWEARYGLAPTSFNAPTSDADNDGITLMQEFLLKTNPGVLAVNDSSNTAGLKVYTAGF